MNQIARILLLVVLVPLLGIIAAKVARSGFEAEFQRDIAQLIREDPESAPDWEGVTFGEYCAEVADDPDTCPIDASSCRSHGQTSTLMAGSLFTLLLGLALLGGVLYASHSATLDRNKLLRLFGPGVRLVLFGAFALILLQSLIASYGLLVAEYAVLHHVHWMLVMAILGAGIAGSLYMIRAGLSAFKPAESETLGIAITRDEQQKLWQFVDRIAKFLGAKPPRNIVLGLDPTFFVTNAAVRMVADGRTFSSGTMYLSLPLMRIMTAKELGAVIGHELAHFRGEDTRFSMEFYPIYAGSANALCALRANAGERGWEGIPLWPAIEIMGLFLDRFAVAESKIGRNRELLADRAGAQVGGAISIATSLLKIGAYIGNWERVEGRMADAADHGRSIGNASLAFGQLCAGGPVANPLEVIGAEPPSHPTDSHPPTAWRIRALGLDEKAIPRDSLNPAPAQASSLLIENLTGLEESLTQLAEQFAHEEPEE